MVHRNPATVIPVVIRDFTEAIKAKELTRTAAALQRQVNEHFGRPAPQGWGCKVAVRAGGFMPSPDEWVLGLFTQADQPGALGYHDRTPAGLPLMKVFPALCRQSKVPWSACASHELLETLADPEINRAAQAPDGNFYAMEVCDGVEADTYEIDGVVVSNFATPQYFEPSSDTTGQKYDWLGLCKSPLENRPGGYNQFFDPQNGWTQVRYNKISAYRQAVIGRGARRAAGPHGP